jgi:stage II sporulation protein D
VWTLWHDREVQLIPASHDHRVTLRVCAQCITLTFTRPLVVRAADNAVVLVGAGRSRRVDHLLLASPVTLSAHGETITLRNPVSMSAHSGTLVLVVTLPIESYVERVLASESSSADTPESLKALAIVVRTFALHENHGHQDYDLCDSTHCQLLHWGGNPSRSAEAHAATLATAGETLWFHGQRALAYFSKDCGGRTAAVDEVWPAARPVPYLSSRADPYCVRDGGRGWASELTRSELTSALATHALARPGWQNLLVARRGESGRAVTLRLDSSEIPAEQFRIAVGESLGWNRIPSTWFEVSRQGDRFEFHGRGWGHGVGLCQKGAAVMAQESHSAREILQQYFPGADAADEATGRTWQSFAGSGFVLESLDAGDAQFLPELARARAEAAQRSELNARQTFTVRAFSSTQTFRSATLAPGWVAAFTEGDWIGAQPLRTLAARGLLVDTMRHEFLHALIEQQAGPGAQLWLREGLVEMWSEGGGESVAPERPSAPNLNAIDTALSQPASEEQSEAAHRAAEGYAAQLLACYGRAQVLEWLRSGVPGSIVATLGQR